MVNLNFSAAWADGANMVLSPAITASETIVASAKRIERFFVLLDIASSLNKLKNSKINAYKPVMRPRVAA
jgi:hypothetical protein